MRWLVSVIDVFLAVVWSGERVSGIVDVCVCVCVMWWGS